MIKFECPNCSHRIGAPDDYAGKKARCSKCKQPVRIPATPLISHTASGKPPTKDVIKFRCNKCDQKIAVPAIHAGKRVKCKKCENICAAAAVGPAIEPASLRLAEDETFGQDVFGDQMDLSELAQGQSVEIEGPKEVEGDQERPTEIRKHGILQDLKPERKRPWPIDMLLYPLSLSGILTIVFVVTTDFYEDIAYGSLLGFGVGLYATWYCCQCVHTSAQGGLRAPGPLDIKGGFDIWEEIVRYIKVIVSGLFFAGPLIGYFIYCAYIKSTPSIPVTLSLAAYGVLFFPMGLLAMILFDSLAALNPWLLVRSIISTFPQYICLVVAFYGLGATYYYLVLRAMFNIIPRADDVAEKMATATAAKDVMPAPIEIMGDIFVLRIVSAVGFMWLLMVLCHLLGRFFYKNEEKLYWEV